jgi:hypothetical protein
VFRMRYESISLDSGGFEVDGVERGLSAFVLCD